jgi:hypothetical protein
MRARPVRPDPEYPGWELLLVFIVMPLTVVGFWLLATLIGPTG